MRGALLLMSLVFLLAFGGDDPFGEGVRAFREGRFEDALHRFDEAERAFATVGSMGQLRPDTAFYWAKLSVDRGRTEQAIQLLESALANPSQFVMRDEAEDLLEKLQPKKK